MPSADQSAGGFRRDLRFVIQEHFLSAKDAKDAKKSC